VEIGSHDWHPVHCIWKHTVGFVVSQTVLTFYAPIYDLHLMCFTPQSFEWLTCIFALLRNLLPPISVVLNHSRLAVPYRSSNQFVAPSNITICYEVWSHFENVVLMDY